MSAQSTATAASTSQVAVRRIAAAGLILGGVAVILGALLPWAQATVPIAGTLTRSGIDSGNDAVFCIVVGAAACLVGLRTMLLGGPAPDSATERAVVGLVGMLGLICVVFAAAAARHVDDRLGSVLGSLPDLARRFVSAGVGNGIWVVGAGGAVIALGALVQVLSSRGNAAVAGR